MLNLFKRLGKEKTATPEVPERLIDGQAYIIGDIHGCYSQMVELLNLIKDDITSRPKQTTRIIFLGDLVDRGPDSKGVLDFLMRYNPEYATVEFLMGNHEEVFLSVLSGNIKSLTSWMGFGGRSCLRSYGVENLGRIHSDPAGLMNDVKSSIPQTHAQFIQSFKDFTTVGPYLCVHAGVKPGVSLENQTPRDMRWIREKFISYRRPHEYIVVHGHTIVPKPLKLSNRIAIDTGCYSGGRITALRVDNDGTEFLQSAEYIKEKKAKL